MECSVWKILCRGLTDTLYKCKVLLFLSMVLSTSKTPVADLLTIAEPEGRRAHVPLFFFFRFYYLFLERGEGKEKERERNMCKRNIDRFPLAHPRCALARNRPGDLLLCRMTPNPLSPTSQGLLNASYGPVTLGHVVRLS